MRSLFLSVHGVEAELRSGDALLLDELRRDFEYFERAHESAGPRIVWEFFAQDPPDPPEGALRFRARDYEARDRGGERWVRYGEPSALAAYDYSSRAGRIYCASGDRLRELAYLAVLSRVGEELDLRGLHRAHGLGFESGGRAGLILLPSGGGKSSLALEMLRSTDLGLLSEESPLVSSDMTLRAFPLRMGFRASDRLDGVGERWIRRFPRKQYGEKRLVDLGFFRDRVCESAPLSWLFVGRREDGARPRVESVSKGEALAALGLHLALGWGVAQMSEYMLRLAGAGVLARIALRRSQAALRLAASLPCRRFVLGSQPRANIEALTGFLETCGG